MPTPEDEFEYISLRINSSYYLLVSWLYGAMLLILLCKDMFVGLGLASLSLICGLFVTTRNQFVAAIFAADPLAKTIVSGAFIIGFFYALAGYFVPYDDRRVMVIGVILIGSVLFHFAPLKRRTLNSLAQRFYKEKYGRDLPAVIVAKFLGER
jgi:hypothetical protein